MTSVLIQKLMSTSGVKFGTSGARGLADAITDEVAYSYTRAFLIHLIESGRMSKNRQLAIAGDLRPSSPRIMLAISRAAVDLKFKVINGGMIPSPAIALFGMAEYIPSIMVTGSHIPDDRNGIKFNRPEGEIDKTDETGIKAAQIDIDEKLFDGNGAFVQSYDHLEVSSLPIELYLKRWPDFFGDKCLDGLRLGVYQHSTVGRDHLVQIFESMGAHVQALGRSDKFIPVDTEAIRPEDVVLAKDWCADGEFDALISADGDCDRPLLSDENGSWIRGDVLGILGARYLDADGVATPVSCNTALEKCGIFEAIQRTKIGSPYVIEAMGKLANNGAQKIVGYEANGGFLQHSKLYNEGRILTTLPTRDPVIVCVAVLLAGLKAQVKLSELLKTIPARFTASDRIKNFPSELSHSKLESLHFGELSEDISAFNVAFKALGLEAKGLDDTDGLRYTLSDDRVVHLRGSGNAPELRCYTESDSEVDAVELMRSCLSLMETWKNQM